MVSLIALETKDFIIFRCTVISWLYIYVLQSDNESAPYSVFLYYFNTKEILQR